MDRRKDFSKTSRKPGEHPIRQMKRPKKKVWNRT